MNLVYNIIAYLFFILLFAKVIVHVYLDNANGYKFVVSPISTWVYLFPYDKEVSDEFIRKKMLCNTLQKLIIIFLCLVIITLVIKIFLK
jgi:hypothetical protein